MKRCFFGYRLINPELKVLQSSLHKIIKSVYLFISGRNGQNLTPRILKLVATCHAFSAVAVRCVSSLSKVLPKCDKRICKLEVATRLSLINVNREWVNEKERPLTELFQIKTKGNRYEKKAAFHKTPKNKFLF